MQPTYVLSDIVSALPIPPRTLIAWADDRVIHADKKSAGAGSGVHRRFPIGEVEIAAILSALAPYRFPTRTLKSIADWIREIQRVPVRLKLRHDHHAELVLAQDSYLKRKINDPRTADELKPQRDPELPLPLAPLSQEVRDWIKVWLEYDRARNPRFAEGERIVLRLAITETGQFFGYFNHEGSDDPAAIPPQAVESYLTIRLSNVLARLKEKMA
jgi:hypothetical protein